MMLITGYKICSKNLVNIVMAVLNGAMIFIYANLLLNSLNYQYFIGRTNREIQYTIDFEEFSQIKVSYFLYLNMTDNAIDAIDHRNRYVI